MSSYSKFLLPHSSYWLLFVIMVKILVNFFYCGYSKGEKKRCKVNAFNGAYLCAIMQRSSNINFPVFCNFWNMQRVIILILTFMFSDNTAGIVARRSGYSRRQQELYFLPVVIEDSSYPIQSSTNTMTIRVCRCDSDGTILSCNVEAIFLPVGLSTGALIAILLCIVILLG